jgi:hypothetical protein
VLHLEFLLMKSFLVSQFCQRIELASKELQLEKLQKQITNIQACFGKI